MSFFHGTIFSRTLQMETGLSIVFPTNIKYSCDKKNVIFLLHGLSGNSYSFIRYTNLDRYFENTNSIIVMPEVQRSFYLNMKYGLDYYTYVSEELVSIAETFLNVAISKENMSIGGYSMGGYGALLIGLSNPSKFSNIYAMSSPINIFESLKLIDLLDEKEQEFLKKQWIGVLGETKYDEKCDILRLSKQVTSLSLEEMPYLHLMCATEDNYYKIYEQHVFYENYLRDIGYTKFKASAISGGHDFNVWDAFLKKISEEV